MPTSNERKMLSSNEALKRVKELGLLNNNRLNGCYGAESYNVA